MYFFCVNVLIIKNPLLYFALGYQIDSYIVLKFMNAKNTSASASSTKATKVASKVIKSKKAIIAPKVATQKASTKVIYLKEGIKGKQLQAAKIESNRLNKEELSSLSFQIKQFNKHGANYLKCFKGAKMDDITPKNLVPFLTAKDTEKQAKNGSKWSYWLLESVIKRYYSSK